MAKLLPFRKGEDNCFRFSVYLLVLCFECYVPRRDLDHVPEEVDCPPRARRSATPGSPTTSWRTCPAKHTDARLWPATLDTPTYVPAPKGVERFSTSTSLRINAVWVHRQPRQRRGSPRRAPRFGHRLRQPNLPSCDQSNKVRCQLHRCSTTVPKSMQDDGAIRHFMHRTTVTDRILGVRSPRLSRRVRLPSKCSFLQLRSVL